MPLPCCPPVVDDPTVVLLDVRHHLPLVVDVPGHRPGVVVDQHLRQ